MAAIGQARPATPGNIRTPLFIVGIALALLAFLIMFAFGIVFANKTQSGAQLKVVVTTRDVQAREPITADMITISSVPATAAPPKVFSRLADLSGFSAVVAIPKGQAITTNLVASNPDQVNESSYLPIPKGYVALTLPDGEQQGVGGYIAQGDYINVLAVVNTAQFSSLNPRSVTRTVFTRVHVIRVGSQSVAPRQGAVQGIASSITVVMTLCDAQYVEWLLINTTIKYVLIPYTDYGESPADPACPTTSAPPTIGPVQVEARWGFTKA